MDTLDDVSDASKYTGSMYKEFMLKCETSESVLEMLSNAWRAVRIEVGNNFLPILKDVAGFGLDKLNDFRLDPAGYNGTGKGSNRVPAE